MRKPGTTALIAELLQEHALKRAAIQKRLGEFRAVPVAGYFYELAYCLMTPQSSAANAFKAQKALERADFRGAGINPEQFLHQKEYYVRFHKTKSKHLLEMRRRFREINAVACGALPAPGKRKWLAENVLGLSYKEATHFLRNIGRNDGLAILDRHILRNLLKYGAVRSLPKALTPKRYLAIEKKFQTFAETIGVPIDELDLLFWSAETGEILK